MAGGKPATDVECLALLCFALISFALLCCASHCIDLRCGGLIDPQIIHVRALHNGRGSRGACKSPPNAQAGTGCNQWDVEQHA